MQNYEELIRHLQAENDILRKENFRLREIINKNNIVDKVSDVDTNLDKIFLNDICILDETGSLNLKRTYHSLKRAGFNTLLDLENLSFNDLAKINNIGVVSIALIYVICKHYKIYINNDCSNIKFSELQTLNNYIKEFEKTVVF